MYMYMCIQMNKCMNMRENNSGPDIHVHVHDKQAKVKIYTQDSFQRKNCPGNKHANCMTSHTLYTCTGWNIRLRVFTHLFYVHDSSIRFYTSSFRRASLPPVTEDPSCKHHLYWPSPPETVLVVKKIRDLEVTVKFKTIISFLMKVCSS